MSNILITGISGFVGSHLVQWLKNESGNGNNNIIGIVRDSISSMWLDKALDNIILVKGDIRDYDLVSRVINHYDIDQIYHIASFANVKQAWKDPRLVYSSNVMGTINVLEAARQINKDGIKILVMQTDKVYGEKIGAIETDPYIESEPYATSKICQGFIAKSYIKTYGMNIVMPSSCNIFGYDPFNSRLIGNVIKDCIRGNKPVIWTNDKSVREYVYIDDVVDALVKIMNMKKEHSYSTYNIYTGWIFNQKEIVEKIASKFNIEPEYNENAHIQYQIQEETMKSIHWNWKPFYTFDKAIDETIEKFELYEDDWNKRY